jgi:hypothetical protein
MTVKSRRQARDHCWRSHGPAEESGSECPADIVGDLGRLLDPVEGTLTWGRARLSAHGISAERLRAPQSLYGFSGSLRLRLHRKADNEHAIWLGRLAVLAPFVGTGYHVQLGLGATDLVGGRRPPGSAGPPAP